MKKKTLMQVCMIAGYLFCCSVALACPVCERQQPKAIRGITHGVPTGDKADYLIVSVAVLIVIVTLYLSLRYLIRPGEHDVRHIKRLILND